MLERIGRYGAAQDRSGQSHEPDRTRRAAVRRGDQVFGSKRLTGVLLDRVTPHVHILEMNGESYRLRQSRKTKQGPDRTRSLALADPQGINLNTATFRGPVLLRPYNKALLNSIQFHVSDVLQ